MNPTSKTDAAAEDLASDIGDKRRRHIAITDNMPGPLRACVHEFGFSIVSAFIDAGVKDPRIIRHLVHVTWAGARESAQRRAPKNGPLATLDWVLAQSGSPITALNLWRLLYSASWVIVPMHPTLNMLDASMEEVSAFNVACTKQEKHRRRIEAAIKAFAKDVERHIEVSA
jgi:hypothetical protein